MSENTEEFPPDQPTTEPNADSTPRLDITLDTDVDDIEDDADLPSAPPPGLDVAAMPGGVHGAVEAILMVIEEPVTEAQLASALNVPVDVIQGVMHDLASDYYGATGGRSRGFELRPVAGGWRIFSHPAYAEAVNRFITDGQTARLTQAALETLAVIAYRQPVSRGRISAIRGVNVDGVVRTLMARGLIEESGVEGESGAVLYQTSAYFLERMGMTSVDDLPPLAPYLPDVEGLDEIDGEDGA